MVYGNGVECMKKREAFISLKDQEKATQEIYIYIYKLTTYLKDLPLQSVSSKKNLQVVDKFRKTCELFLCSKTKRGRVGVQIPCIPFFVRWFTWNLFL